MIRVGRSAGVFVIAAISAMTLESVRIAPAAAAVAAGSPAAPPTP